MKRTMIALLGLAFIALTVVAQDTPEPSEETKPVPETTPDKWSYGMFGLALRPNMTLAQGTAKDSKGNVTVTSGDKLLKWNGKDLKTTDDFCRALYASKPGEVVTVTVSRRVKGKRKRQTVEAEVKLGDRKDVLKDLYRGRDKRRRTWAWNRDSRAATHASPLRRVMAKDIEEADFAGDFQNLVNAHRRELDLYDCFESRSLAELLLTDPLSAQTATVEATEGLRLAHFHGDGFTRLVPALAKLNDQEFTASEASPFVPMHTPSAMKTVIANLAKIGAQHASDDEALFRDFEYVWKGSKGWDKVVASVHSARKTYRPATDLDSLDANLGTLRWVTRQLKAGTYNTPSGKVIVGTTGNDTHEIGADVVAVLDPAGDDTYTGWVGSPSKGKHLGLVLDLAGDDEYRSQHRFGLASAVCGLGLLVDDAGDDTYTSGDWSLACAYHGSAFLIDAKGNDRYQSANFSLGCAAYGTAALVDGAGNDTYSSDVYSIGVGLPNGTGVVLDRDGDDTYRCNGKYPSSYGTKGEWQGWGIGCGFGYRSLAAGGVGVVMDCDGNDSYDAGEFGLGCGYFLGVGVVRDFKGDDVYHASRYGLATAAHCAAGLFMDDSGHDFYRGKTAANMAGVWDIATGFFYEGSGHDVYQADGLAMGAASQNAFGIFWDRAGHDSYRAKAGSCLGSGGATTYGAGRLARNFGWFRDDSGDDQYVNGVGVNNTRDTDGKGGFFSD